MIGRLKITDDQLVDVLNQAFECGRSSCFDLKEQCIGEIIESLKSREQGFWRVFSVEELRNLPTGTKLYHSQLGEGSVFIPAAPSAQKAINFRKEIMYLQDNDWPWNEPMRIT